MKERHSEETSRQYLFMAEGMNAEIIKEVSTISH